MPDKQEDTVEEEGVLESLRRLIMQPELDKIEQLQQRLDNKVSFTEEISEVLPDAIMRSNKQDNKLDKALLPVIEESIKASVTKDLSFFADALYPIMGPAIRKSIAEAFKELLQAVNVALENSLSRQGLQWRWESVRTGRPFSEIVLLRSLVYRAEQVFLIHRETGNLLQHVAIKMDGVQDADMVSGMLTAISDFAQDSFAIQKKSILDSFQIDDLTVLVEAGPMAILAIAIRGDAPESTRDVLHTALESIHFKQRESLAHFAGDALPFEQSRPYLEDCLQSQFKEKKSGALFSLPTAIVVVTVMLLACWWMFSTYQEHVNWNHYLDKLSQEPGIVITNVSEHSGHFSIHGLRDPLAKHPQVLRTDNTPVAEENISFQLEPYQALTPTFILQRASIALAKPERVSFSLKGGILKAEGTSSSQWQREARKMARLVAGVHAYDDSGMIVNFDLNTFDAPETVTLILNDGVLFAKGSAPYQWIEQARIRAATITELKQYDDNGLTSIELAQIKRLIPQLEQKTILFQANSFAKSIKQQTGGGVVDNIKELLSLSKVLGKQLIITIIGHTDDIGRYDTNILLSQKRANSLYQYFVSQGIPESIFQVQGVGSNMPLGNDPTGADRELNRSVTFAVQLESWK